MKKKIVAMLLVSAFALSIVACGSSTDMDSTETETAETSMVESGDSEDEVSDLEDSDSEDAEVADSETTDLSVSPSVIYDNYDITITASTYHHDESQDYILLTIENNSDMDIEIDGYDFIANGSEVDDSYYSFLYQEISAGETLEESEFDGIYFESGTLPDGVTTLETLSFSIVIYDMDDYHTVDDVTIDLTME